MYRHKCYLVHRLVAKTFCTNWSDTCVVHHKDRDKFNNNYQNLVCMTDAEHSLFHRSTWPSNIKKGKDNPCYGRPSKNRKPVIQYTREGQFIAEYESLGKAHEVTGVATAGNFIWRHKNA